MTETFSNAKKKVSSMMSGLWKRMPKYMKISSGGKEFTYYLDKLIGLETKRPNFLHGTF